MVRKLALAVVFILGGLPLSVYGIGLGNIKTNSALNQVFRGEIQLLSVPRGELDTLQVKLASRETFAKAGSEYQHVLSQLKFKPVRRKDGSAVILVSSNDVIRESFLGFLVEVSWPNGRLVREYTVLLDPPVTTKRRPAGISKPKTSTRKKTKSATAEVLTPKKPETPSTTSATGMYGPVAASETLWRIATKLKPNGVSVYQMMMALLNANPHAFVNNNIYGLQKGTMLRVPGIDEIKVLSAQDALVSFQQQTREWKEDTLKMTESTAALPATSKAQTAEAEPVKDDEDARQQITAARPEGDEETGASETGIADAASEEDTKHEPMLESGSVETSSLDTMDLEATVSDMASKLEDMQRLLTLQDEQLAQLSAKADRDEARTSTGVQEESDVIIDQAREPIEKPANRDSEHAEVDISIDTEPAETVAVSAPESATDKVAGTAPPPVSPPALPMETAAEQGQKTSWLEDNLALLAAVAGGLFGVGVLVALFHGNRRKRSLALESSTLNEEPLPSESEHQDGTSSKNLVEQANSLSGEYSAAEDVQEQDVQIPEEDTSEVDPIAAADVYIAYDRFEEAQKILENEIARGDDRLPVHNKLLEIYFKTQNQQDFSALVDRMVQDDLIKKGSVAWKPIQKMGVILDEYNPLFVNPASTAAVTEETEDSLDLNSKQRVMDSFGDEVTESPGELERMELDLSSSDTDGISESDEIAGSGSLEDEGVAENDFAESGLDLDVADLSELDEAAPSGTDGNTGIGNEEITFAESLEDIAVGDEVDTKLELARAYMEMGDHEGATSILKEVLEDGDADQTSAASELIAQLNS